MPVTTAATNSLNVPPFKAVLSTGVDAVVEVARRAGFTTLDGQYGPAISIGGVDITALDLTYGYSVLANNGMMVGIPTTRTYDTGERALDPVMIREIKDRDGNVIWSAQRERYRQQVVPADVNPGYRLGDRTDLKYYVAQYDANVRVADEAIAKLLDEARAQGLLDDALVILTSDHGESLGEHDSWFVHGPLPYNTTARVPLVFLGTDVPAGRRVGRPVELIDLYPTLVGAGYEVVCASRHPERARALEPEKRWVQCDVSDPDSTRRALEGCDVAYYLVHSLASGPGWPEREVRTAEVFRGAAAAQRLERIVYLGGMAPKGVPSPHLQSRLLCGEILRGGLVPTFELMRELFEILHRRRHRRGSVDFDLPEPEVVLDTDGFISDIIASERNVAHRLIEEFMLLANETVASHLERAGMPSLYRIHEPPDPLKVEEFETFIGSLGFTLGAPPGAVRPTHFQKLIEKIRGLPVERPIAFLMLRTMQKARYDPVNLGHFGLAARSYTHFTSPIRRYPDLVVHRRLRELRQGTVTGERREALELALPEVGRHTSERERRASEAERELVQWKKVRFMADKVGDIFDGYITGVTHFGLFVELVELADRLAQGLSLRAVLAWGFRRRRPRGSAPAAAGRSSTAQPQNNHEQPFHGAHPDDGRPARRGVGQRQHRRPGQAGHRHPV